MTGEQKQKKREPLFHLVKQDMLDFKMRWCVRTAAFVLSLILCAIITAVITKSNFFDFFGNLIEGNFGTTRRIWRLLKDIALLLCVALAITPAFKMRFWNIGAEGQIFAGIIASAAWMVYAGGLESPIPPVPLFLLMFVSSVLAGALWGIIPAVFKAFWGTNETLFTLMMNYVATQLVAFFIVKWENPKGSGSVGIINQASKIGWFPNLANQQYLLPILIVALLTVVMFFYLRSSKHGYEISVVGESEKTARYIGINVKRVIIRTMAISGAICGLVGFLLVGGTDHTITTTLTGGRGFTAIMVSWLAKFDPLYMVLTSFLFGFLNGGANEIVIANSRTLNHNFTDVLIGIVLFFVIGSEFFVQYRPVLSEYGKRVFSGIRGRIASLFKKDGKEKGGDEA